MLGLAPAADVLRLPKLPLTGTYRTVRKHADRTLAEFRPFVSAYLLVIGLLILLKAVRLSPTQEDAQVSYAAPLGLIGGFLDAVGGGGWGPW